MPREPSPGEARSPGQMPSPGDKPSPGQVPSAGETPSPGDEPSPGQTPSPGDEPSPGDKPSPGQTPSPGQVPSSGETPSPGEPPSARDRDSDQDRGQDRDKIGRGATPTSVAPRSRGPDASRAAQAIRTARPVEHTAEALFESHGAMVWRALRYLGVAEQDLADASQDVFVVVHRKLPEFRGASRPETWLYGIALRVAQSFRRRQRRREEPVADLPDIPVEATQEHALWRRRARELILRALDTLDARQREVFILHEVEQLPMADVARIVGCPRFTAYSRLRLARKRMRRQLVEWVGQEVA